MGVGVTYGVLNVIERLADLVRQLVATDTTNEMKILAALQFGAPASGLPEPLGCDMRFGWIAGVHTWFD